VSRILSLTVVTLLWCATPAIGDVIETGSTQRVSVSNECGTFTDGPYEQVGVPVLGGLNAYLESFAWDDMGGGSSGALHDSTVAHGVYSALFSVRTDAGAGILGPGVAIGMAECHFEVLFTLTDATDFNLAGSHNAFGEINGAISLTEIRIDNVGAGGTPSQTIVYTTDACCPSVNVDGTLLPGDYALRATSLAIVDHSFLPSYNESNAETNFTMTLDLPAPQAGDLNCSGGVDGDDVAAFVLVLVNPDQYDAAFPACDKTLADMNDDDACDGDDIAAFIQCVITAACP
jgi:hypothetical protein